MSNITRIKNTNTNKIRINIMRCLRNSTVRREIGHEPADLTYTPPPPNDQVWVYFFA